MDWRFWITVIVLSLMALGGSFVYACMRAAEEFRMEKWRTLVRFGVDLYHSKAHEYAPPPSPKLYAENDRATTLADYENWPPAYVKDKLSGKSCSPESAAALRASLEKLGVPSRRSDGTFVSRKKK